MAERCLQPHFHGLCLLVGTGRKSHGEARMIVNDGQRIQPRTAAQSHASLEVHLPQRVRRSPLEAPIGAAGAVRRDAAMTRQHRVHGRSRRRLNPITPKNRRDLARAPRRMRSAHRQDPRFQLIRKTARTAQRPAGAILKGLLTGRQPPQPHMSRLPADPDDLSTVPTYRDGRNKPDHDSVKSRSLPFPIQFSNSHVVRMCIITPVVMTARGGARNSHIASPSMRARGTPDARAHPQPRVQKVKSTRASSPRSRRFHPAFRTQWLERLAA